MLVDVTLYNKIAAEIKARIAAGIYKPGQKIPSIRKVAAEFKCNKLTVQKAYEKLVRAGLLENSVGRGSFVRFPERIEGSGDRFDFKSDYLSPALFPYRRAQMIFWDLFESEKGNALSTPPVQGDPQLLSLLQKIYQVPKEHMIIVSGAQQGLDLIAKVFSAQVSDEILFEDPTYPLAISLFKARHFVPMENDGPNLKSLEQAFARRIKLFYSMPAIHNPTGISYTSEKRVTIARLAEKYGTYIIEDDCLSEFKPEFQPRFVDIMPQKTIFIKSLSQTTTAGLRLGFMVVPPDLHAKFLFTKFTSDLASTGILQKFALQFFGSGEFDQYLQKTRQRIEKRREILITLIKQYPDLSIKLPQHGFSLWIKATKELPFTAMSFCCGANFSFSPQFKSYFRISFSNLDDDNFDQGVIYLSELLNQIN
jgi:DNA-binding transcriptional MocR family regulator